MAVFVMLTVDLNQSASTSVREKFYDSLAKSQWTKLALTTTWTASFKDGATVAAVLAATKRDVEVAAAAAGGPKYEAAAMAGEQAPTTW